MSSSFISQLMMFISVVQVQAVYQMDLFFQPPVLANDQVIQNCVQYIDSELTDDYLTNCLLIDQLPNWKPSESAVKNNWNSNKVDIQGVSYTLNYRISCYLDFYGESCSTFCKASNDPIQGFYSCSSEGEKVCFSGYTGSSCTQKKSETTQVILRTEHKISAEMPIIINYTFEMSCAVLFIFLGVAFFSCLVLTLIYFCQRQRLTTETKVMIPTVSGKLQYFCEDIPPRYSNTPKESDYAEIIDSSKDIFIV